MTLPNPTTSANGSKLFALFHNVTGTNTNAAVKAIRPEQTTLAGSEWGAHMAVATHKDTDTYAAGDAVVLMAGIYNSTDIMPVSVNSSGNVNVAGTVSLGSGSANCGYFALTAGSSIIGSTMDAGWDFSGRTAGYGNANINDTTETSILTATASNYWYVTDVEISWYTGSTAPTAGTYIIFRHGTGTDPAFLYHYIEPEASKVGWASYQFRVPVKATTANKAVTCKLNNALGTGGSYGVTICGYKTT